MAHDRGLAYVLAFVLVTLIGVVKAMAKCVKEKMGKNWPIVTANIDEVSVDTNDVGAFWNLYIATLTYSYNSAENEKQTGTYKKKFDKDDLEEARSWAQSYKGCRVPVHVNPKDPADSILLDRDLEGIAQCVQPMQPNT